LAGFLEKLSKSSSRSLVINSGGNSSKHKGSKGEITFEGSDLMKKRMQIKKLNSGKDLIKDEN